MKNIMNRLSELINRIRYDRMIQRQLLVAVCVICLLVLLYVYSSEARSSKIAEANAPEITQDITEEIPTTNEIIVSTVNSTTEDERKSIDSVTDEVTQTEQEDLFIEEEQEPIRENTLYYVFDDECAYYLKEEYQDYLWSKLKEYNHTDLYETCIALMYHESEFQEDVISKTNDHGLMQINAGNFNWLRDTLNISSLDDPYDNIDCGVYILTSAFEKYGDIEAALVAYNQGHCGEVRSTKYSRCILKHDMDCLHILYIGEPH